MVSSGQCQWLVRTGRQIKALSAHIRKMVCFMTVVSSSQPQDGPPLAGSRQVKEVARCVVCKGAHLRYELDEPGHGDAVQRMHVWRCLRVSQPRQRVGLTPGIQTLRATMPCIPCLAPDQRS